MIYKNYLSVNIQVKNFEQQFERELQLDEHRFVLKWIKGRPLAIMSIKVSGAKFKNRELLSTPVREIDGSFAIRLGEFSEKEKIKVDFQVYAFAAIPKLKTAIVNAGQKKVLVFKPTKAFKKLKNQESWNDTITTK